MTNVGEILCNCVPYPIHGVNGTTVYVSLCMVQVPLSANIYNDVVGWCKTWTMDYGLDRGLDCGLNYAEVIDVF